MSTQHEGIFYIRKKTSTLIISTAEKKILIALCYYVIFAVLTFMTFGFNLANADLFTEALETYFRCEALGHLLNQTSQCDPKEYQQYLYPEVTATTTFLFGFISTANLTFVISWSTVTKFCSQFYHKKAKLAKFIIANSHLPVVSDVTSSSQL